MWTYDKPNMKLISKVQEFQSIDKEWEIPLEGTEGFVKEKNSGEVIGLKQRKDCSYGVKLQLQPRGKKKGNCQASSDSEKWFRSKNDAQGWFTLKNVENGLFLTPNNKKKFKLKGTYICHL